jgi:hypothetical protein
VNYYFDAAVSHGASFSQSVIQACDASSGDQMQWWDPSSSAWEGVSPAATYLNGCLTFVANSSSSPSFSDLFGTAFAVTAPATGGGGAVASASAPAAAAAPVLSAISPNGGPAAGGTTVTITGSGFTGASSVTFGTVPAQSFTVGSSTEITAVSPAGSGTVDVRVTTPGGTSASSAADQFTYAPSPSCGVAFADVPTGYWAAPAIRALACKGIVNGFPDGTFQPEAAVTRAQFVKMLDLTLGIAPVQKATPFSDVPVGAWYAPYVSGAAQAGIVDGISANQFGADLPLSRQQLAVMIARALHLSGTGITSFTDQSTIAPWAQNAVQADVDAGYLRGFPNGSFQPLTTATRAQAAQVLDLVLASR